MRYYYGIIFKGERIVIKKWLSVAAIATVAGLTLFNAEIQTRKQTIQQQLKLRLLTVVVQESTLGQSQELVERRN